MTLRRIFNLLAVAFTVGTGTAAAVEDWPFSHRLISEATRLAKAGDFRGAIGKFREAYAAAPDREILFDIGVTYETLAERGGGADDIRLGIDSFERYLKTRPPRAADRAEARASLAKLREMLFKATGERPKQEEKRPPRKVSAPRGRPDGKTAEPASVMQPAPVVPVAPAAPPPPEVAPEKQAAKPAAETPRVPAEKQEGTRPAAAAQATPASTRWSPWRLTLTIGGAALGLVALGAAIGLLVESNNLTQTALSAVEDPKTWILTSRFILPELQGKQRDALISLAIAGAGFLTATISAIWPHSSLSVQTRLGTVALSIVPTGFGLAFGGSF